MALGSWVGRLVTVNVEPPQRSEVMRRLVNVTFHGVVVEGKPHPRQGPPLLFFPWSRIVSVELHANG